MDAQLLTLPCGCVIDAEERLTYHRGIAECPWCCASFLVDEWARWLAEPTAAPLWVAPKPLEVVRLGDRVLELVGGCECGSRRARNCGGEGEPEVHLVVPDGELETLRN